MNPGELFNLRNEILDECRDDDGFLDESKIISYLTPMLLEAKLVDSEDYNESFYLDNDMKINAHLVNESGERLQLFLLDEESIVHSENKEQVYESEKNVYEAQFKRAQKFFRSAIEGKLLQKMQDSDPVKAIAVELASDKILKQIDVVEIFLISMTATVTYRGQDVRCREMYFENEVMKIKKSALVNSKDILIIKRLIDLNFISKILESRGHREPLIVNFNRDFSGAIPAIKAASGSDFESYLCVLSGEVLAQLYRLYAGRLLEKNVRSFLQFKGVNRGIRDTIRDCPERFIAFNNGITITSTDCVISQDKKQLLIESLSDFQIVNGGQTTAAVYFSKKDGLDVSDVRIMAKINVVKNSNPEILDELISKISTYSNAQSRVSSVDLRSRNPYLVKIKMLSNSVIDPSGNKWFFERFRAEFITQLRQAGKNSAALKRSFPPERRFTKEELGKYFLSWGPRPFLIKKGGEKVFRYFIEELDTFTSEKDFEIDRNFYENLIAKIIIFRSCEKIYGQGKNAIGQLRSAAVPYAISALFMMFDNHGKLFDMEKIWKLGRLDQDLSLFLRDLLILMNTLIKKYSLSDDHGEYAKKEDLWLTISSCGELNTFISAADAGVIKAKYEAKTKR